MIFIQDSVSVHVTKDIIQDLEERDIVCINWSSYSPDLNPIENVWNWIKDWIQEHYDDHLRGYDELQEVITAAWNAVPTEYLLELLESMSVRCQAVIDANGMHTRY